MGKHVAASTTQIEFPWQTMIRTIVEGLICLAAGAPLIYQAATLQDPALAGGGVGAALAVSAAVTRVWNLPVVEAWFQRFIPWLAAAPGDLERKRRAASDG